MTRIWERIFLGSEEDANDLAESNPNGIMSVITLCGEPVRRKASGINYLHFPIRPFGGINQAKFDQIIDAIAENVRWGMVLLNCSVGMSRSPAMLAAYMDAVGYKTLNDAIREIAALRPTVAPEPVLLKSIRQHLG